MDEIEVVVKISEEAYRYAKKYNGSSMLTLREREMGMCMDAIANGIPLKGHGRIGDLDALERDMIGGIKSANFEEGYADYAHINNVDDCVDCVRYADTIIEADNN